MQWSLSESAVIPIIMMITILRLSRGSMGVYLLSVVGEGACYREMCRMNLLLLIAYPEISVRVVVVGPHDLSRAAHLC